MAEAWQKRMIYVLGLICKAINKHIDFDVVSIDFCNSFKTHSTYPEKITISNSEIEKLISIAKSDYNVPFSRDINGSRETAFLCGVIEKADNIIEEFPVQMMLVRYSLNTYQGDKCHRWSLDEWTPIVYYNTLLDFVLIEYFKDCRLFFPNADPEAAIQRGGEEYLRNIMPKLSDSYRKKMIECVSAHSDKAMCKLADAQNYHFCLDIERISFYKNEKEIAKGKILITSYDIIEKLDYKIRFLNPISIKNHRMVRKLLQISSEDTYLVGTVTHVFGFVPNKQMLFENQKGRMKKPEFILIDVIGISHWCVGVLQEGIFQKVLENKSQCYQYPLPRFNLESFEDNLSKKFKSEYSKDKIFELVNMAIDQKHGTMIIFSENAKSEVERLNSCCIPINPVALDEIIKTATSIDGAIFCDNFGVCYAIGTIIDGEHKEGNGENISRGARHNSARRYIGWKDDNIVIVIISEDGDVTVLPEV